VDPYSELDRFGVRQTAPVGLQGRFDQLRRLSSGQITRFLARGNGCTPSAGMMLTPVPNCVLNLVPNRVLSVGHFIQARMGHFS